MASSAWPPGAWGLQASVAPVSAALSALLSAVYKQKKVNYYLFYRNYFKSVVSSFQIVCCIGNILHEWHLRCINDFMLRHKNVFTVIFFFIIYFFISFIKQFAH